MGYGKDQVFLVLRGERRDLDRNSREIDALVLPQNPSIHDLADDVAAVDALYQEFDQTIRKKNARAGFKVFRQRLERGANQRRGAMHVLRRDGQVLPSHQLHRLVVLEFAGTDLRTLQIGQNAHRLALRRRDFPDHADQLGLLRVAAVREVQAGNVHPGMHQFAEDIRRAARWPQSGHDLGTAILSRDGKIIGSAG